MANAKILEQKSLVVDEIKGKFENAKSVVVFDPRGLNVAEVTELRRALRESGSDYKVYKNTLVKRAVNSLDIKLDEFLEGPSAISFSSDELAPVKVISEFAKKHTNLELKAGIVEGKVAEASELAKYAAIPSREGLLTMLAAGLMGTVKDLSICLDLYAKQKEEFINSLNEMSILEIKELVDAMKEAYGVDPSAVAVAGPAVAAVEEGPSKVNVVLTAAGANKIAVIKLVRDLTGLGLKEAKDIADNGGNVKEGIDKEEAEKIKAQFEEAGATVELK